VQGVRTFGGKSLHHVAPGSLNPYEIAITLIGKTLSSFDDDGLIVRNFCFFVGLLFDFLHSLLLALVI
jgi:hypothetical protein